MATFSVDEPEACAKSVEIHESVVLVSYSNMPGSFPYQKSANLAFSSSKLHEMWRKKQITNI